MKVKPTKPTIQADVTLDGVPLVTVRRATALTGWCRTAICAKARGNEIPGAVCGSGLSGWLIPIEWATTHRNQGVGRPRTKAKTAEQPSTKQNRGQK